MAVSLSVFLQTNLVILRPFLKRKGRFYFLSEQIMTDTEKKNYAVDLLRKKAEDIGRLPKKEDFEPTEVSRIKSCLGPWPRALEYAGLKEPNPTAEKPKKRNAGKAKAQRLKGLKKLEKSRNIQRKTEE